MFRRVVIPAVGLAFATLLVLGLVVGWVGASRAYVVGVHTLYENHVPGVAVAAAFGLIGSILLGRTFVGRREISVAIAAVVATDVFVALVATAAISEMTRHPEILRAVVAESAGGLQVAFIAIGLVIGRVAAGRSSEWSVQR